MRTSACGALALLAACSSGGSGTDAAPPALGPLMPQAIAGDRSAVMLTPTVMPITWDTDPARADIEAFFPQYAASPAWAIQTAEYGVGSLSTAPPQRLTGSPASNDGLVQQLLMTNLSGATPAWGAPSENTIYSLFFPLGIAFAAPDGTQCCVDFDGYHSDVLIGGVDVAYAIQCTCGSDFPPPGITPLQELTTTAAHETVESATDPRIADDPAYSDVDPAHEVWAYVTDGELADLCEFTDTQYWTDAPDMTYTIQRVWSNAAARAGTDPCVGDPTAPYYQTVPEQPDDALIAPFGENIASKGTKIAVGATGTVTLRLAGSPGSGPFTIVAQDVATLFFGATSPLLTFVQPAGIFQLGDTVTIEVTVHGADTALAGTGAEAFEIDTAPVDGGPTTYYYGLISQ